MSMGRPQVVSDEQIVARARAVFLERGYAASTLRIAAAVGISWGAIARRFASKRALFTCAMAAPAEAGGHAVLQRAAADLPALLEQLRADLWERWPRHLQYRLATPSEAPEICSADLLDPLAQALEAHARAGTVRAELGPQALARIVLDLLTGDVAQRFLAREPALPADPALIDSVVRLLSPRGLPRQASAIETLTEST